MNIISKLTLRALLVCSLYSQISYSMEHPDHLDNCHTNTRWDDLSDELKVLIGGLLNVSDVLPAELVSREWYTFTNDNMAWKQRVQNDFPEYQGNCEEGESWEDMYKKLKMEPERVKRLIKQEIEEEGELSLHSMKIFSLPSDFGDLIPPEVEVITLCNNYFTSLPVNIADLTHLKVLNLSNNKLRALPNGLSNLTNLERLVLHNNQLQSLPNEVIGLTKLNHLNLNNNQLQSLPNNLSKLTHLKGLRINNNPLDPLCLAKYLESAPIGQVIELSFNLWHAIFLGENGIGIRELYQDSWLSQSKQAAIIIKIL